MRAAISVVLMLAFAGSALAVSGTTPAEATTPAVVTVTQLPGLSAPARVSFDGFDNPLIEASTFADALRVEGFLHARHRYFQMDLMRRNAAGELCELVGPLSLSLDTPRARLQLRNIARTSLAQLPEEHRKLLDSYVDGVNQGLATIPKTPPEYTLLQVKPVPWTSEDSILVVLSMCSMLNDTARVETSIGTAARVLPDDVLSFLTTPYSSFDHPVIEEATQWTPPPIPGPTSFDTRTKAKGALDTKNPSTKVTPDADDSGKTKDRQKKSDRTPELDHRMEVVLTAMEESALAFDDLEFDVHARLDRLAQGVRCGSNGWVVSGRHTPHGVAILANDMHLPITAPSIWYRASLSFTEDGRARTLDGLTLAGVPGLVSGSNGHVAWGFTNVEGDFIDFVIVESDPADPSKYLIPGGSEPFITETIALKPRAVPERSLEVRRTRYGPIVGTDTLGRMLALRWTALDEGSVNLALLDLARVESVPDALDVAARWRGPQQNVMVAGADGSIGWTISGALPVRRGYDGSRPVSWSDGTRGWIGEMGAPHAVSDDAPDGARTDDPSLTPKSAVPDARDIPAGATDAASPPAHAIARPRVIDPPSGLIVTANQRTVPLDVAAVIGTLWADADRADRIEALLKERLEEAATRSTGDSSVDDSRLSSSTAEKRTIDEAFCAGVQLDTSIPMLVRWRDAITPTIAERCKERAADGAPTERAKRCSAIAESLAAWNGRADVSETAVGLADGIRRRLRIAILAGIAEAALSQITPAVTDAERTAIVDAITRLPAQDESLLRIVRDRPPHLLPPFSSSWDALIEQIAIESAANVRNGDTLITWGKLNVSNFRHPLAQAIPALAARFMLPTHEQPGHPGSVRVATPTFSASGRMIVAPGREANGLMQVPGGQSGDPGSAHWADQHASWRDGRPQPLRPGEAVSVIEFVPSAEAP